MDLALNNLQWLICHQIKPNQSNLSKPWLTVPSAPITTGITFILIFRNFLSFLYASKYLYLFSFSLIFPLRSTGTAKSTIW